MQKIFLDTNIYIIGQLKPSSPANIILTNLGYHHPYPMSVTKVIISQELIKQILRVGKRLQGKDWAAQIIDKIWQNLNCLFITETSEMIAEANEIMTKSLIPTEDILIYLTAKYGEADVFVSENRKLIKVIADFDCVNSQEFVRKYLDS